MLATLSDRFVQLRGVITQLKKSSVFPSIAQLQRKHGTASAVISCNFSSLLLRNLIRSDLLTETQAAIPVLIGVTSPFPASVRAAPKTRLGGRSAHDVRASPRSTTGATISCRCPEIACDTAAADSSKTMPAYAHSFSRRNPGTTSVMAPGIFRTPRIASKYTG